METQNQEQLQRLERLNALANKAKAWEALTDEELAEHARLREEYRLAFRAAFRGILDNPYIQQPDGSRKKLTRQD